MNWMSEFDNTSMKCRMLGMATGFLRSDPLPEWVKTEIEDEPTTTSGN